MLIQLLRTYLRPYRSMIWLTVVLATLGTISALYLPSLNASIIDDGVAKGDADYIWRTGAIMLAVSAVQVVCAIASVYFGAKAAMSFGRDLRAAIFDRVLSFSTRELSHFGAPSLITRNTNDVQQVQMLVVMSATLLLSAPITMVGGIVMALQEDVGLSWLVVVAVPVLAGSLWLVVRTMPPLFRAMQGRIDSVNRILREQITGIRVVRAFVREPYETARFERASAELTDVQTRAGKRFAAMFPIVMLVLNVSSVAVLWFGAHRVADQSMQVGSLTAFLTYLIQILMAVMMATFLMMLLPRAMVCSERIGEVLATESSVVTAEDPVTSLPRTPKVEFKQASFTYPGADFPVLREVTFTASAGQTTAIIGSTGSGKTTLVSLLPRLFDVTGGQVLVGGVKVSELAPELLWEQIGWVPQKPYLFTGTVASNLRYGNPEATDDELWAALRTAQAADFVAATPEQLEAPITQGGTNLSGGQRQRLSIARALVKQPAVYIFDDSFSALDVATDARLRSALRAETTTSCVIIVAQRVATIRDADQILVLDDGALVGIGRHDDLLQSCPEYAEIVDSQLSAQEAAA